MNATMEKPVLRMLVSYALIADVFTAPALVSLELAAQFQAEGWMVVGPDPQDEIDLAAWERARPWAQRFTS